MMRSRDKACRLFFHALLVGAITVSGWGERVSPGWNADLRTSAGQVTPSAGAKGLQEPPQDLISLGDLPTAILSDTQGVDFQPYLRTALRGIYERWMSLLPEDARPPKKASGETVIRFTIAPDGALSAMHLDGSTHNDALNRAAWEAVSGASFAALPKQFRGPNLTLRVHFKVNE